MTLQELTNALLDKHIEVTSVFTEDGKQHQTSERIAILTVKYLPSINKILITEGLNGMHLTWAEAETLATNQAVSLYKDFGGLQIASDIKFF